MEICCEFLQDALQLPAYDSDQRASHPLLGKMCPKAGGKEELALNIYLLHASSPPLKGEEPRACPGDLTDAELRGNHTRWSCSGNKTGILESGFPRSKVKLSFPPRR